MEERYNRDKSLKEEKTKRHPPNPSFSSCLLDEIYRSIDGGDEKFGEFKQRKQKVSKKQSVKNGGGGSRGRLKSKSAVEDEDIAGFRQACLAEKWMEIKGNKKVTTSGRRPLSLLEFDQKFPLDNDPIFFSSGSSSSDSSFGWYSEAEAEKPKPSCFGPLNRVKTRVSSRSVDEDIRLKTRTLKMYTSVKKMKQPISPGGRLTAFISAIFTNAHSKKQKDLGYLDKNKARTKSKSTNMSTCSSASLFSRSCLRKNPHDHLSDGQHFQNLPPPATFPCPRMKKLPNFSEFLNDKSIDDEDDMASDTSSDLFELDHLVMFKNHQYCEELPVYETTNLATNRAIASRLLR